MFRLNRLTDYAVVVMSQLALRGEETLSAQSIARDTAVPLPTVSKVLGLLAEQGIRLVKYADLQADERGTLRQHFIENIFIYIY